MKISLPLRLGKPTIGVLISQGKAQNDCRQELLSLESGGYSKGEAVEAWRTADSGGLNLLRNLQQAELSEEIDQLKTAINTSNGEGDSA